jgi:DNA mismatch repair protein MutS
MSDASTPLMRQYNSIKQQAPNALLMFRLGDFYELFFEDAVIASRDLEITLTARNKEKGAAIPMCGVPYHAAEGYISRLIQKGHRVAICEQMEDPKVAKKLVKREITRVVTPGTAMDANLVRSHENNYLAAVARIGERIGLAHVDLSTGEFRVTEMDPGDAVASLDQIGAREVLFPGNLPLFAQQNESNGRFVRTDLEEWIFTTDYAGRTLRDHFHLLSLDGCGLADRPAAVSAAGAILHYLRETQRAALEHLDRPTWYERADAMVLDAVTMRNLELTEPIFAAPPGSMRAQPTLLGVLDQTLTGMGGRLLRQRLLRPSMDRAEIEHRLDALGELLKQTIVRAELRKRLSGVLDIERLLAKVTLGSAGPRELLALGRSLEKVPALKRALVEGRSPGAASRLGAIHERLDELPDVTNSILEAIADEPPLNITDGGTIRAGFHPELDELRDLKQNGQQYIAQIETRERQRTGIQSLKVRFNNVFGYYIEITRANQHLAPADYERKQTLANAERFTTPELKDYERKVLDAEEKILALEKELFTRVRQQTAAQAQRVRGTASAVAELDVTAALAQVAAENRYQRPAFNSGGEMTILAGRHPVIERLPEQESGRFIPNDLYLNDSANLIGLITGPNMGGKSTYLRQAALIAILAQMGSFVPAESADLPILDRIFTRIGASDTLTRGRSTFMVEMTETAVILNTATSRRLVVLDEIGRGTATYDGLALAWAVVEHIHARTRAKTLFATHYHELTELAEQLEGVRNLRVSVKEAGDHIIFLWKVEPGKADRSYGIEVARLAGLPPAVIERAREVLKLHESTEHVVTEELTEHSKVDQGPMQIQLFEPVGYGIAERIRALNLDQLRPIEALQLLAELQKELKRQ